MTHTPPVADNNRFAPRVLPRPENDPIQILIPRTGKKLLGFLLDESADGLAIQVRRTTCLAAGDEVQVARSGRTEDALVKSVTTCGISSRIGLEWAEPFDDMALVETIGLRR